MSLICLLLSVLSLTGSIMPVDSVTARMDIQKWMYPQEEIYLATEKDQFISGDTVKMDLELLDAMSRSPSELSKYIYVELLTPFDEVAERVKLIRREGGFGGFMPLPADLPEGEYVLVAYTRYMENLQPGFFARKRIHVISSQRGKNYVAYSCDSKTGNLTISVNSLSAKTDESLPAVITVKTKSGKIHSSVRKKTSFSCKVNKEDWKAGVVLLEADNFKTFKPLPYEPESVNIRIFPEGGHFVHNSVNTAVIRITDATGRGVEKNVEIIGKDNTPVVDANTDVHGLGRFKMYADINEDYSLVVGSDTIPANFKIAEEPTIAVNTIKDRLFSVQPVGSVVDSTLLLIHNRGNLIFYDFVSGNQTLTFDAQKVETGIYEFILRSKEMHPLAVRQAFVTTEELDGRMLAISLVNELGEDFPDSENIPTSLDRKTRYWIDNVMLTAERWKRYDIAQVISGKYSEPLMPLEIGGTISGVVKSRWKRKGIANARVDVVAPSIDYFSSVQTDSEGRFVIDGVDWPEGTGFAVKVTNKDGELEDNFEFDEETYPTIHVIPPYYEENIVKEELSDDVADRLGNWLEEVVVEGKHDRDSDEEYDYLLETLGAKSVTSEFIESRGITTYEEAIRQFAGVRVSGGRVTYAAGAGSLYGGDNSVEFYVDGTKWVSTMQSISDRSESRPAQQAMSMAAERTAVTMTGGLLPKDIAIQQHVSNNSDLAEFASTFPFHNIDRIYFLRPSAAIFLSGSAARTGGALLFVTKNGAGKHALDDNLQVKVISPLGYQP